MRTSAINADVRDIARRYVEAKLASAPQAEEIDPTPLLSDVQRAAWECTASVRALLWARRTGKTWWAALWLLIGARANPNSLSIYLALTSKSARHIVWPALRDVCRAIGIPDECLHEHTLTVRLPNGATIVCSGTDDVRTIETWRGTKLLRAVVDECGAQPDSYLRYLIDDILRPALLDLRGQLALCGTPGLVCRGHWYELTGPERLVNIPLFRGTVLDNPAIPHAREALEELLEEKGWTRETAAYRREWLAEWCEDSEGLVFPLAAMNITSELPKVNTHGARLNPARWRYVIGVDVGVVDATAISIVASHPDVPREYVVSTEKHVRWITTQLRDRLRVLLVEYPKAPIILDTGGMGKLHAEELTRQWAIAVEPAEKREKESAIRDVRDRLLAGRLLVLSGGANDALTDEWAALGWDEDKRLPDSNAEDHASDATIYALRKLRHYREKDPPPAPSEKELVQREIDAMKRIREREVRAALNCSGRAWDA